MDSDKSSPNENCIHYHSGTNRARSSKGTLDCAIILKLPKKAKILIPYGALHDNIFHVIKGNIKLILKF